MTPLETEQVTVLLKAWAAGDAFALDRLTSLIYEELRRMARGYMRNERADNTLQTTALVHEAYIRLVNVKNVNWSDRVHFFAVSAQIMRRILVDAARARGAAIVTMDVLPGNQRVLAMIAHHWPGASIDHSADCIIIRARLPRQHPGARRLAA